MGILKHKNDLILKNPNYYDKTKDDNLYLNDGTVIKFEDAGDWSYNYADWSALEDTGFFQDTSINKDTLKLELCNYGFTINGYFVPCYSWQNGWYSTDIHISAYDKDGILIQKITTEGDWFDEKNEI